jgi:hypothetical protein
VSFLFKLRSLLKITYHTMASTEKHPITSGAGTNGEEEIEEVTKEADQKLGKMEIRNLISQNSSRISYRSNEGPRIKSSAWTNFKIVCVDTNPAGFVKCIKCSTLLKWKIEQGTSLLNRHNCGGAANATKLQTSNALVKSMATRTSEQLSIKNFAKQVVPEVELKNLNIDIVIGLAKDLRPLNTVEGSGFRRICQSLINFGAKYGAQTVKDSIYHRTTLKRTYLPQISQSKRSEIRELLITAPSKPKFAFTADMWSDKHKQRHFLSLTVHFVSQQYDLKSNMLAVDEFPDDEKTTLNISKEYSRMMQHYFQPDELENIIKKSYIVTDGGSNMVKSLPNQLPCQCHRLNLMLAWTFNDKPVPCQSSVSRKPPTPKKLFRLTDKCPKMKGALTAVKDIVTYFKRSGLNSKLKTTLKQDVTTRWNSQLIMLESFLNVSSEVRLLLLERNKLDKLVGIDDTIIKELVDFLLPFRDCSEKLSGEKYPTINLVALYFHKLAIHITVKESDSTEMQNLKTQAGICFEEYCTLSTIYYAACALDPM